MVTASVKMEVSVSNHVPTIQPALTASTVLTSFLEDQLMEDFVNVSLLTFFLFFYYTSFRFQMCIILDPR